jgi:UDP-3-O-[3-hydroxymyristoyl] glucosamine N-acyltransferase
MDSRLEFAYSRYKELEPGIGRNCSIGDKVVIGEGTQIGNNVVIENGVTIGKRCFIQHGAVIGQKGFGFATTPDGTPVRITHTGGVIIGDDVEIGVSTAVACGTVDPTTIEDHVKIDGHVYISHNNRIGEKTMITTGATLGGSVTVGKRCFLGINCTIKNKITIADNTLIGLQSCVHNDITKPGTTAFGNPARQI